jgi:hypothetical protein
MGHRVFLIVLAAMLCGCMSRGIPIRKKESVIKVTEASIPFERQFEMREGDALQFELPNGKTVAVWCERATSPMGEQTTASGIDAVWGERPFKHLKPRREQIGPNSYALSGWESYIGQGAVTTHGAETSEYELFIDEWRFSITKNLQATGALPVTIRVTHTNRKNS